MAHPARQTMLKGHQDDHKIDILTATADTIEQLVVEYIQQEGSPQKAAQAFAIKTMDNTPPGSQARAVQVAWAFAKRAPSSATRALTNTGTHAGDHEKVLRW